jgi:hypothetical protein
VHVIHVFMKQNVLSVEYRIIIILTINIGQDSLVEKAATVIINFQKD